MNTRLVAVFASVLFLSANFVIANEVCDNESPGIFYDTSSTSYVLPNGDAVAFEVNTNCCDFTITFQYKIQQTSTEENNSAAKLEEIKSRKKVHASDIFGALAATCVQAGNVSAADRKDKPQAVLNLAATVLATASDFTHKENRALSRDKTILHLTSLAEAMVQVLASDQSGDIRSTQTPFLRCVYLVEDEALRRKLIVRILNSAPDALSFVAELLSTLYHYLADAVLFVVEKIHEKTSAILWGKEDKDDVACVDCKPKETREDILETCVVLRDAAGLFRAADIQQEIDIELEETIELFNSLLAVLLVEEEKLDKHSFVSELVCLVERLYSGCVSIGEELLPAMVTIPHFVKNLNNCDLQKDRELLIERNLLTLATGKIILGELKICLRAYLGVKAANFVKGLFDSVSVIIKHHYNNKAVNLEE
jgi:hypothetical protein